MENSKKDNIEEEKVEQHARGIEELSLVELKAFGYDQIAMIERSQNNLKAINEEIMRRQQQK